MSSSESIRILGAKELHMKFLTLIFAVAALSAADTKMKMEDLPLAVQDTVKEQTKTGTLSGVSKEVEKGKTMYEVETKVGGKTRDLMLNETGEVLSVEEEVDLDSIPAPAKAAFQKRAAGGSIEKVEKVTAGSNVNYEAELKLKSGKKVEAAFNADGSVHK